MMKPTEKTIRLMVEVPASALTVVSAPPDLVTQANVEAVTGFSRGVYLVDLVPAFEAAGGTVARVGKTRAVPRVEFVAWLLSHRTAARTPGVENSEDDAFAAEFGLVPARPALRPASTAAAKRGGKRRSET